MSQKSRTRQQCAAAQQGASTMLCASRGGEMYHKPPPPIHRHTQDTECASAQALRHDLRAQQDLFEESALLIGFVTLDNLLDVLESVPISANKEQQTSSSHFENCKLK